MITIYNFVFNELAVNSFVLYDDSKACIIIDPGCNTPVEVNELTRFISANNLKPVAVVNTHGHFDHVYGNARIKSLYNCPLYIHREDISLLEHVDKYAGIFGFIVEKSPMPDNYLIDGEYIAFGNSRLKIIHVPGHSPGGVCLYSEEDHFLIGGDVLFNGSIGRSDFPGGNHQLLINGIKEKLMVLPYNTVVWPGHGPKTTIGAEHDTNPFLT
jgi:glyoxylase-like metal-dependent hydrolase (beta-lactamase superfamily II)